MRRVEAAEIAARQLEFAAFEREFVYPLGDDAFWIDHGRDYLAFFTGLGSPDVWIAERDGQLIGVAVAVLRRLPHPVGYVCDLKVRRGVPERGLARCLLAGVLGPLRAASTPGFGVSMNPATGGNRLTRVARRIVGVELRDGPQLGIWSLTFDEWQQVRAEVEGALGTITWFDPAGTKDIVLRSTGRPMPLLHAQHGPFARSDGSATAAPRPDAVHMLCLPLADPLAAALGERIPSRPATASVLHVGMVDFPWQHLLTSDI